jgi:ATP-dependent DNA ligase
MIARKRAGRVRLFTRRGYDWTDRYPLISDAVAGLPARSITIGGVSWRSASAWGPIPGPEAAASPGFLDSSP